MSGSWQEVTSHLGRNLIDSNFDLNCVPTHSEYWSEYLGPLSLKLASEINVKPFKVTRVSKAFLSASEEPVSGSRFSDLFRVIYTVKPDDVSGVDYPKEVLENLKDSIEMYEMADVVIDATGVLGNPLAMGPAGTKALNESAKAVAEFVDYGADGLLKITNKDFLKDVKDLTIVGSDVLAASALNMLDDWLSLDGSFLNIVTTESRAFLSLESKESQSYLWQQVDALMEKYYHRWQKEAEQYRSDLQAWRALPSEERAKIEAPIEPKPKVRVLGKCNVMAVDRLVDREGIFLSAEKSALRSEQVTEHAKTLETWKADRVLVFTGHRALSSLFEQMQTDYHMKTGKSAADGSHPEKGVYTLGSGHERAGRDLLSDGVEQVELVMKHLMTLFSRAD
jgi:predicted chitinase